MATVLNFYHLGKVIPEGAVYIGRAMPHLGLQGSKFANPFKLTDEMYRDAVIQQYRVWLWSQIVCTKKITEQDLLDLEGKDVVCFCKHKTKEVACHGDVVLAAVEWAINRRENNDIEHRRT